MRSRKTFARKSTLHPDVTDAAQRKHKSLDEKFSRSEKALRESLDTLKEHLKKQKETQQYSEEKVAEYIESRAKGEETKETRT